MKLALSVVALGASLTATGLSRAQPPDAAPSNALELSVGAGYTQGFGNLKSGVGMPSVVTPGFGVELGIGYRIDPKWAVLWSGQYQVLTAERAAAAYGFTTSIAAQYHLAPAQRVDPWVEVGGGYRLLFEEPSIGPALMTQGFQLARVRAGIDFRASESVAMGPLIGADATLFTFQDSPDVFTYIRDPRISTFVFAGLQGRFDIPLTRR